MAADLGTEHADADGHELHEDSRLITDQMSLTIISWLDEAQIIAFTAAEDDVEQ